MQRSQLDVLNEVPFLAWVKDADGRYIWGNRTICAFAKEDVVGKTDAELMWAANAEGLRADDVEVLRTKQPIFRHEYVDKSEKGKATLNVCKFPAELDGKHASWGCHSSSRTDRRLDARRNA
jgi:PAS domain-containing protein